MRRDRSWPHKNGVLDVAARQEVVRQTPGWGKDEELALRFPADLPGGPAAFAGVQECLTGYVGIPVSVVGPLELELGRYHLDEQGNLVEDGRETVSPLVPLAHSEGGLAVSMHRGCIATRAAGGLRTYVISDRITRASYFALASTEQAVQFSRWIRGHVEDMRKWLADPQNPLAARTSGSGVPLLSRHAVLREVRTHVLGAGCYVLYRYTTGDACGPNMITRNSQALNHHFVARRFAADAGIPALDRNRIVLESNMGGDKKPSYQYFQEGHGKTVIAETFIDHRVLRRHLKCSAADFVALEKIGLHGSHASGMQSAAFTPASAIAGIFAATGQDLGMVGTSSMAHSTAELSDRGVRLSIRLPGLEVGTVGGGTVLPYAQAWLRLLSCAGPGCVYRFAQIVAAATLCLEVSATASMAGDGSANFYRAHLEMGGQHGRR